MAGKSRKFIFMAVFTVFLVFVTAILPAQTAENSKEAGGMTSSTNVELQISTSPEAKLRFNQSFTFPVFAGSDPFTKDNNIKLVLGADVSPVSVNGMGEVILQPAAFFLLSGGGKAGSGWNMPLGNGIGVNKPDSDTEPGPNDPPRKSVLEGDAFGGLLWSAWGAGTLQFDLGALIPGDWTHVVFQTRHEFRYAAYSEANAGDLWIFENDNRDNRNGWEYYASYLLGYRMPASPLLDTVGFMVEMTKPLYDIPEEGRWGEGLGYWIVSSVFNFNILPGFTANLGIQLRTRRNYEGGWNLYDEDYYYDDLELKSGNPLRHLVFYRAAIILNYKIR